MAHLGAPLPSVVVGAADRTGVPCRRHTGAEGGGAELALGDRVWLRGGEGERCVLLLRGSLGPEDDKGGQRRRGVSGWRRLRHLGAVDDFVGRLTTLMTSPFRTLATMSTLKRSGLSDRPLSVARIATPSELGRYVTSAMVFAPNTLLRTSAFCASRMSIPPLESSSEFWCISLFSMSASPASATSPTRSKRIPARPLLTMRLSCTQKPFGWLSESWQNSSHHRPLP